MFASAQQGRWGAPVSSASQPRRLRPAAAVKEAERLPTKLVEISQATGTRRAVDLSGDGTAAAAAAAAATAADGSPEGPLAALRAFFLPRGWPHSVTPDYLRYQLATVPAHVTGWMSHSLATSSMIQALGISSGPAAAVATSAAIRWITKDGLGAAGRLIVGGNLAQVFDEDPRRWRMVAEAVTTLGLSLEIATQVYPAQFVALAGAGTLAKSMAKGMGRPCFRVIQTHFSATNNVGDVAAKEEVWEVAAQLAGLAASVALLQVLESAGRPELAIPAWAVAHSVHVTLRYVALSALRFPYPNQKRAAQLVSAHVGGDSVPSIEAANAAENILMPPSACRPRVAFGCSLEEALQGLATSSDGSSSSSSSNSNGHSGNSTSSLSQAELLQELVALYRGERYLLTWHGGTAHVLLQEGAAPLDLLRAMWQAAWLDRHHGQHAQQDTAAATAAAGAAMTAAPRGNHSGPFEQLNQLAASLEALQQRWPGFVAAAQAEGWQLEKAVLPRGRTLVRLE